MSDPSEPPRRDDSDSADSLIGQHPATPTTHEGEATLPMTLPAEIPIHEPEALPHDPSRPQGIFGPTLPWPNMHPC